MSDNPKSWEESSDLFRAREDEESPRHDVGGSINELLTERTEQDTPHRVAVVDGEQEDTTDEDEAAVVIEVGLDVMGSCGHKIGEVVDVRQDHVVVEKGFLVPEDVYVPRTAIADVDEHHLTLNVSRETSEHSGWDEDPDGIEDEDVTEDVDERL